MITVHGRSRCQFYQGHADWSFLGEVKNAVTLPVIGNGDVAGPDDAAALIARSGVDGVMIGRAACGRPWLPGIIARYLATGARAQEPGLAERMAVVTEHFEGALRHYGVELGLRIMRKHIGWYIHGMTDPDGQRARLMRAGEPDQVREGLSRLFDWNLSHGAHVVADAV
jgi:tRNA-dihydrouridine synthase B